MKYVITGGAGHISKPLAEGLLKAGHQVTVVGRTLSNIQSLVDLGATPAIGSVEEIEFLKKAFAGAEAVYTMVPPNMAAPNLKDFIGQIGKNYTEAIKAAGSVKYIVNLSSIGAHLEEGVGPVSGLHRVERSLNTLTGINIKHLRPAYFYNNFFGNIGMIKHMNIIGSNFGATDFKLPMVDPSEIANAAIEELLQLSFTGQSIRYIASDEKTTEEIASILGKAIGKPELPWVVFTDDQAFEGMKQAGLSEEVSKNYVEMGNSIETGVMSEEYWRHRPDLGKIKLEDFAKTFAVVYASS